MGYSGDYKAYVINQYNSFLYKFTNPLLHTGILRIYPEKNIFYDLIDLQENFLLLPCQTPLLEVLFSESSLYPFFYQNNQQSYYAKPIIVALPQGEIEADSTPVIPPETEFDPFWEEKDPAGPRINPWDRVIEIWRRADWVMREGGGLEAINSVDQLIFEASGDSLNVAGPGTAWSRVSNSQLATNTPSALSLQSTYNSRLLAPLLSTAALTQSVAKIGIQPYVPSRFIPKLNFETYYHPYVNNFISRLNKEGIPGLLCIETQEQSKTGIFEEYQPNEEVVCVREDCIPIEDVDFDFDGAYSLYNWELFFHIPLTIATRLSQDQRFEEAQRWFHYIFNPTDSSPADSLKPWTRYWKVKPFRDTKQETLYELLVNLYEEGDVDRQVKDWREDPFKPHQIARKRLLAYQKTVVMKYIDNLIAWGDRLFRQDTIESINEATQLYILAYNILGRPPERIPAPKDIDPETYQSLKDNYGIGPFGNVYEQFEDADAANPKALTGVQQADFYMGDDLLVTPEDSNLAPPLKSALQRQQTSKRILAPGERSTVGGYLKASIPPPVSVATLFLVTLDNKEDNDSDKRFYFCIPQNEKLLAYWDTVGDRLFKIRHCMNIEGVVRELPLYEPPIDPALLVRAAAKGIDLGSVLNDMYAPRPPYRFNFILQKALELCAEAKSLGASLLSALEKKDAEALSQLRAQQETALLKQMRNLKKQQLEEARKNKDALEQTKAVTEVRFDFYTERVKETNDNKRSSYETLQLDKLEASRAAERVAQIAEFVLSRANSMPDLSVSVGNLGPQPSTSVSTTLGRGNVIPRLEAIARIAHFLAAERSYEANRAAILGGYERRAQEWQLQYDLAQTELEQIEQQIAAADIRIAIAEYDLANHDKQIENAQSVEAFLKDKYTNSELYNWMSNQISTVYFQSYQLAYDLAKRAERAYRFERGITSSDFIQFGYWDSLKKGLLSGEKLQYDLRRLETAYLEYNRREFELTKHISLALLDPLALVKLRETGRCFINLPEEIFDLDYPGHYFRRVKSVSITLPCVVGPYTTISCTLRLLKNSIRINTKNGDNGYPRNTDDQGLPTDDDRFIENNIPVKAIATSNAQNDSGVFELSFRDERYLPFEGAGAVSQWSLELFNDLPSNNPDFGKPLRQFDYSTISDAILHIKYTAREDAGAFKNGAISHLRDYFSQEESKPVLRLINLRQEFPTQWHRFLNPTDPKQGNIFELEMSPNLFPLRDRDKTLKVNSISLLARCTSSGEYTVVMSPPLPEPPPEASNTLSLMPVNAYGDLHFSQKDVKDVPVEVNLTSPPLKWQLHMSRPGGNLKEEVEDILLVLGYQWEES